MTHTEITPEEEELIGLALTYLRNAKVGESEALATFRLTTHWDKLVAKYEWEKRKHFWSKRGIYLVGVIVKRYIKTKSAKRGGQDVQKAKN